MSAGTGPSRWSPWAKMAKEVKNVDLDLVWDPPWNKSMMSEAAKLELNL